ncbi:PVC-type heme-binding CxxCH protein [Membranihabitans marinus]|uniref:PVC-type heme-binding CxxCH protein n=1 Tax=Membranihabitans marinus TaxID=1227546 RepID=UPI001F32A452|nr:PVC-type heme-binding CxxCH protein [Membranihabitans marinus]
MRIKLKMWVLIGLVVSMYSCSSPEGMEKVKNTDHIVLIGDNLGSRMTNFGYFETELQVRYPDSSLVIRNMCDGGNTPGFRPHASRNSPWAFEGAEKFQTELAQNSGSIGHFASPDEWLEHLKADLIIAFFGYNSSFRGPEGLDMWKDELRAFVDHTLAQKYNGETAPRLVLVSPIAYENLSAKMDVPNGEAENVNLGLYAQGMAEVAAEKGVSFVDVFEPSKSWYASSDEDLTIDGFQLNDAGYQKLSLYLTNSIFGNIQAKADSHRDLVRAAVMEKNWMWLNDYKIPNGVHAYGRRYNPFGPDNYPAEIEKIRQMTDIRDQAIWMAATKGEEMDVAAADKETRSLPEVKSNYKPSVKNGNEEYLYGEDAVEKIHTAPGYKVELFASEVEFPDLANPVQMSFDNKGRLWVAVMPSYPHYKPGDAKPNDKLLILEDTDNDGKADKQTVFADQLHLPIGFELAEEGVYLSQGTNLKLLKDNDGDDHVDEEIILLSGFDDHDTHHAHSAYAADPSGAIYMGEGVFLHTSVETPYGPVRGTNGGFYRYNPVRHHLERTAQLPIPNPWGIAFDEWGQNFFAETSGPDVRWMMPGSVKPRYGVGTHKSHNLIEDAHRVRPTSGLEFVSSRHFPDEVQGDLLINNTIGFLGMKQHVMEDDGTGYKSRHRQDLIYGDDKNFRPVDMEFAPDGSLYFIDWHNILIGHMQHNARDPYRDHVHGRVYRVTYPGRPLVEPAKIDGESIEVLLDNLTLPEFRSRYRTRRELRGRDADEVLSKMQTWMQSLDQSDPRYEHYLLEGLWVSWGLNKVDQDLLHQLLKSEDYRVRSAVVRVIRYMGHQLPDQVDLLRQAAADPHGRVRLEAITAASWLEADAGLSVIEIAKNQPIDKWIEHALETADAHLHNVTVAEKKEIAMVSHLKGDDFEKYKLGKEIYSKEGYCETCHQADGKGLSASGFPPLKGTKWALGNEERLIKLVLKGLLGPIEVEGKKYPGQVPMTPYEGLLNDDEVAAVLTYVRNAFGNKASVVSAEKVKEVRASVADKKGFYNPSDLLKEHPME